MNITIREINENDIEKIRQWRNSDLIQNVSYNRDYISADAQKAWYESIKNIKSQLHWVININGVDAGYCAIKHIDLINKRCEFASLYIGNPDFLLNGAGALAEFKIIDYIYSNYANIDKIYCEVLESNKKVVRLHERFGFVIEGVLKQHYFINKQYDNVVLLALFKDSWAEKKPFLERLLIK